METIKETFIPELGTPRRGKVRDIYELEDKLVMIASDRVSCFDCILPDQIPLKGQILTEIAAYWFNQTRDIIDNHVLDHPAGNVLVVKKCQPIAIEVVVRGYLVGSMWRDYQNGKREKCGIAIAEGMKENDQLTQPIVTPTTKSDVHDEDISAQEIVARGLLRQGQWQEIKNKALSLFARGQEKARERGLILLDTKYEFGFDDQGKLLLIDEIHTPDSSRFWFAESHQSFSYPDKEYLRQSLRELGFTGQGQPPSLPAQVKEEAKQRYLSVYESLVGKTFTVNHNPRYALIDGLKSSGIIRGSYVLIVMGSERDAPFVEQITNRLQELNLPHSISVASAHKHTYKLLQLIEQYDKSSEPVVCISVAGRSNALSGVIAANLRWPVIACPNFKDKADYSVNIHSTLQMPSQVPVLAVVDPGNAALAAARILEIAL